MNWLKRRAATPAVEPTDLTGYEDMDLAMLRSVAAGREKLIHDLGFELAVARTTIDDLREQLRAEQATTRRAEKQLQADLPPDLRAAHRKIREQRAALVRQENALADLRDAPTKIRLGGRG